jgi:hypothetical protein
MRFILALTLIVGLASTAACPPGPSPVGPAINAVVDCLGSNREAVDKLKNEFLGPVLGGGSISWTDAKQRAIQAGKEVGGCFIMELTQWFLSGTRATPEQAQAAREAAETFRKEQAGGATFRTTCVREDGTQNECKL